MNYLYDTFRQSALEQLIKRPKLLVWDEVCMSNKHLPECLIAVRGIYSCDLPFGGKVMVFRGDLVRYPQELSMDREPKWLLPV